jgi:hypothetical protein
MSYTAHRILDVTLATGNKMDVRPRHSLTCNLAVIKSNVETFTLAFLN